MPHNNEDRRLCHCDSTCCVETYLKTPLEYFHFLFAKYLMVELLMTFIILCMTYSSTMVEFKCGVAWGNILSIFLTNLFFIVLLYFSNKFYIYTVIGYTISFIVRAWSLINSILIVIPIINSNNSSDVCSKAKNYLTIQWSTLYFGITCFVMFVSVFVALVNKIHICCQTCCKNPTDSIDPKQKSLV